MQMREVQPVCSHSRWIWARAFLSSCWLRSGAKAALKQLSRAVPNYTAPGKGWRLWDHYYWVGRAGSPHRSVADEKWSKQTDWCLKWSREGTFASNETLTAALWFSLLPLLENCTKLSISGTEHCNKTYENYLLLHQAVQFLLTKQDIPEMG